MAISTNDAVQKYGTRDTVTTASTNSVANAGFSSLDDLVSSAGWTNDDDAVQATAVLKVHFETTPTANTTIDLFDRVMNTGAAGEDPPTPNANYEHTYLGSFPVFGGVGGTTATQHTAIQIELPSLVTSQVHEFYVKNNAGVAMETTWDLYVIPTAIGPK